LGVPRISGDFASNRCPFDPHRGPDIIVYHSRRRRHPAFPGESVGNTTSTTFGNFQPSHRGVNKYRHFVWQPNCCPCATHRRCRDHVPLDTVFPEPTGGGRARYVNRNTFVVDNVFPFPDGDSEKILSHHYCLLCEMQFKSRKILNLHQRSDAHIKMDKGLAKFGLQSSPVFFCRMFGKTANLKSNLRPHLAVHDTPKNECVT